ncbi:MAG: lasso peptide biosynthesis B2 protein [Rhodococcus sp. (in: high G+C Gram-positive bacteria)]|uniref:lasso peptide biosynthesis B2 protein n=1 Tax=Rhodococcus sp. TaxID=1831 RepID=UPI002AD6D9EE|nr:lasso peptide biosynthesis B2 protein [Rhodococcus sp. (in: high G+C Gram-positive bacteria)]
MTNTRVPIAYREFALGTNLLLPHLDTPKSKLHGPDMGMATTLLSKIDNDGMGSAIAIYRELHASATRRPVQDSELFRLADEARIRLEEAGYDLGWDRCLHRSFGLGAALLSSGVGVTLTVGVTRWADDSDHEFHAWLSYHGEPIAPHGEVAGAYAPLLVI